MADPPFFGATPAVTMLISKVALMVTFGTKENFRMESIIFDMAYFNLPNKDSLGCSMLAKFMAAAHYAFPTMKIPGPTGPIWAPTDTKSSLVCVEKLYRAVVAIEDDDEDRPVRDCHGKTMIDQSEHTCLKTQTVNSIPNCFSLEVVPLPRGT